MAVQRAGPKSAAVLAAVGAAHSEASGIRGQAESRFQQSNRGRGRAEANAAKGRARARVQRATSEVLAASDRLGEDSAKEQSDGELKKSHFVSCCRRCGPSVNAV